MCLKSVLIVAILNKIVSKKWKTWLYFCAKFDIK